MELNKLDSKNLSIVLRTKFLNLYEILRRIDQKDAVTFVKKNNYYAEKLQKIDKNCQNHGHSHGEVYKVLIPKEELTFKEKALAQITQRWKFEVELPQLLEYLSTRFFNIKERGVKDWNEEAEDFVLREVLKEGITAYYHKKLSEFLKNEGKKSSTEQLLVANPTQWIEKYKQHEFNLISAEKMKELFFKNYTYIENFQNLEFINGLQNEIEFLEMDGRFTRGFSNHIETKEKFLYLARYHVDKENFPFCEKLAVTLSSLPFELNSKLNYGFQISETVMISCYGEEYEIRNRNDGVSSESNFDLGVCFSLFLFLETFNDSGKGIELQLGEENIKSKKGAMVMLKSRKQTYKLISGLKNQKKGFLIQYWVLGPKDLKNEKF